MTREVFICSSLASPKPLPSVAAQNAARFIDYPENMRKVVEALKPPFHYLMETEVHVYAFSVAANVLLSFFPFLIVTMSLSRRVFGLAGAAGAIDLALRGYF